MSRELYRKRIIEFILMLIVTIFGITIIILTDMFLYDKELKQRYIKKEGNRSRDFTCEVLRKDNLYVVTEDIFNKDINYYKIDNKNKLYDARSFEYDKIKKLYPFGCLNRYISENDEMYYRLVLDRCKIIDDDKNEIEYGDDIINIIKLMAKKLSKSVELWYILIQNDNYYVVMKSNERYYTLYSLFEYKNNNLHKLVSFDDEKIITLKSID